MKRIVVTLALIAGGLTIVMPPASAQTHNVNTVADTLDFICDAANCSIRDAFFEANSSNDPDTIRLQQGLIYDLAMPAGDITVSTRIDLDGRGSTILGGPAFTDRLITIDINGELFVDNTTFEAGNAASQGGAIFNNGILTIEDSTFRGNQATASSGGAISNDGLAELNVTNVTFENNSANTGGAIQTDGEFVVRNSTFFQNTASNSGGAMIITTSGPNTAEIIDTTFDDNQADLDGGAIASTADPNTGLQISRSVFTGNDALGTNPAFGEGGAIIHSTGEMNVEDSTFTLNTAFERGGAITTYGAMSIVRSTFSANDASGDPTDIATGGAIADANASNELSITNSTFSANTAEDDGGGLFSEGEPTVTNSTFTLNRANDNADLVGHGGAVASTGTGMSVRGSIMFGNFDDSLLLPQTDCATGAVVNNGGNLFAADGFCPAGVSNVDPGLMPLASNGGLTQTHALPAGSSAIDINDDDTACGGTDQRSAPRPNQENCDAGAYERVFCSGTLANIVGTNDDDVLVGTGAADGILGLDGKDSISSGGGNDRVCAGKGDDSINGGTGKDRLFGEDGKDKINGGKKRDKCFGGPQRDTFRKCERIRQ